MADKRRFDIEEREDICTKGQSIKSEDYLVILWCTSSRIWRQVKNDEVSDKELSVARSNKRCGKIHERVWYVIILRS